MLLIAFCGTGVWHRGQQFLPAISDEYALPLHCLQRQTRPPEDLEPPPSVVMREGKGRGIKGSEIRFREQRRPHSEQSS